MKKKTIALVLAMFLLIGGTLGVTLAYLNDKTEDVTNTFTIGKVDIELTETPNTDSDGDGENDKWEAMLVPGTEYAKDPVVKVIRANTNVDIYLFVKVTETNNPSTYLEYTLNTTGWTQGDGTNIPSNVYYREVSKTDTTIEWNLLTDNKVTVKTTVGSTAVPMPDESETPSITFTAYGIQKDNLTAQAAWAQFNQ